MIHGAVNLRIDDDWKQDKTNHPQICRSKRRINSPHKVCNAHKNVPLPVHSNTFSLTLQAHVGYRPTNLVCYSPITVISSTAHSGRYHILLVPTDLFVGQSSFSGICLYMYIFLPIEIASFL